MRTPNCAAPSLPCPIACSSTAPYVRTWGSSRKWPCIWRRCWWASTDVLTRLSIVRPCPSGTPSVEARDGWPATPTSDGAIGWDGTRASGCLWPQGPRGSLRASVSGPLPPPISRWPRPSSPRENTRARGLRAWARPPQDTTWPTRVSRAPKTIGADSNDTERCLSSHPNATAASEAGSSDSGGGWQQASARSWKAFTTSS
jgi:hypothetical protein